MDHVAADRGGSFGRNGHETRNWMRASPPGIAFRCRPAESSPIGSDAHTRRESATKSRRARFLAVIVLLAGVGGVPLYRVADVAANVYRDPLIKPETVEDFEQTRRLMQDIQFDNSFIFKYSARPGTPAARLADSPTRSVKSGRCS